MSDSPPPPQHQERQPGLEGQMQPMPEIIRESYRGSGKLEGKAALITGGDSGIGRAVAVHFAREGADVAIVYFDEHKDAEGTAEMVRREGRQCLLMPGDIRKDAFCVKAVEQCFGHFGRLDILVNNAAVQYPHSSIDEVTREAVENTFAVNVLPHFAFTKAALKHMKAGAAIINSTSVISYQGSGRLIDYSATKGAVTGFTRAISQNVAAAGIRVNAVAPGPVWTPLIPATFDEDSVANFGKQGLLDRPAQPSEIAPAYVYLASEDSSYVIGAVIHINGGSYIGP